MKRFIFIFNFFIKFGDWKTSKCNLISGFCCTTYTLLVLQGGKVLLLLNVCAVIVISNTVKHFIPFFFLIGDMDEPMTLWLQQWAPSNFAPNSCQLFVLLANDVSIMLLSLRYFLLEEAF